MSCTDHCSVFPRARANAGDAWRLEATLRRLESGRCLQVAVIGEAPQQLPCMQAETYAERFVGLLQRHHSCVDRHGRRGHHTLLDLREDRLTPEEAIERLPSASVDVDLWLLQWPRLQRSHLVASARGGVAATTPGLEQLLRRLLLRPCAGALVAIHYAPLSWRQAAALDDNLAAVSGKAERARDDFETIPRPSMLTTEDAHSGLLRYYAVPSLSLRAAGARGMSSGAACADDVWPCERVARSLAGALLALLDEQRGSWAAAARHADATRATPTDAAWPGLPPPLGNLFTSWNFTDARPPCMLDAPPPPPPLPALGMSDDSVSLVEGVFAPSWHGLMRRARSVVGDGERVHGVLRRLARGDCVTVIALGGSITCGSQGQGHKHPDRPRGVADAWPELLQRWLRTNYPNCRRRGASAEHVVHNRCKAAAGTQHTLLHVEALLPADEDVDLVIGEFAINDLKPTDAKGATERLLRRLLTHPAAPAVVYLEAIWMRTSTPVHPFYAAPETMRLAVLQHYGIPTVSIRDGVLPEFLRYRERDHPWGECCVFVDGKHPTRSFHAVIAQAVAFMLLEELAVQKKGAAAGGSCGGHAQLPPPLFIRDDEAAATLRHASTLLRVIDLSQPLPAGASLANVGWELRADVPNKFGLIASAPTAHLRLALNVTAACRVVIGYLRSYDKAMGDAVAFFEDAPTAAVALPGWWEDRVSVYQTVELTRPASKAPGSAVLVIETRPRRTRGEHEPRGAFKFKLLDVVVSKLVRQ